ncbi:MAG: alpha/beta hydrolase fold containing protein [Bacteroidetes bacterium]|jgi:pimeloyl-ACP methyl ester carboxylesterase|nr:alpha/beta hydrolase fold containing protein [Bacteroidota bacterium]
MKLHFRKFGQGQPMIILHGLFGQSDNWNSLGKQFAESGFEVYVVDQRNHGLSPHSDEWSFQFMSDDLAELIKDNNLRNVILIGHSLGGKTVMLYTLQNPSRVDKLIVADIAPKYYPPHHQSVLAGLNAVDFNTVKTRREAEDILTAHLPDFGTRQFLLKNIYWKEDGKLDWRFNLKVISENMENVGADIPQSDSVDVPALFIRGANSNYILDEDIDTIQELFPRMMLGTIEGAGHWVHAEKPKEFFESVINFVK